MIEDNAIAYRQSLGILDGFRESMARGDRLTVRCFQVRAAGTVCEVDGDLVSLRNIGAGRVDLHLREGLPYIVQVSEAAVVPGATAPIPSGGFRGRLLALDASGDEFSTWVLGEHESLEGRIEVGTDCIWINSRLGARMMVPLSAVIAVTPRV